MVLYTGSEMLVAKALWCWSLHTPYCSSKTLSKSQDNPCKSRAGLRVKV